MDPLARNIERRLVLRIWTWDETSEAEVPRLAFDSREKYARSHQISLVLDLLSLSGMTSANDMKSFLPESLTAKSTVHR